MFVIHRSVGRSTDRLALLFLVKMRTTRVDHRVHGDRVMHESIVGIDPMIGESTIQLYEHSARCPTAMEMFLRCNHPYRSFASMTKDHRNQLRSSADLDLYNAAIVAVRRSFYSPPCHVDH